MKNIDQNYYCSNYHDINFNENSVKCEKLLRFWENEVWINSMNPYGWFQWYFRYWLGRRFLDDKRQIDIWKGIASRFTGKIVKMVKEINGRFDDYLISSKIRKNLLHYSFELVENDLLQFFLVHIKMSYYWFNKQELLQRAKDRHYNVEEKKKLLNVIL